MKEIIKKTWWLPMLVVGLFFMVNCTSSHDQTSSSSQEDKFLKMTAAEHLAEAKNKLKDIKTASKSDIYFAYKHLEAIPEDKQESSEAKKLLVQAREREIDIKQNEIETIRHNSETLRASTINQRIDFANELEREYLKKGMDVYMELSGDDKTTMEMSYVFMSRPLVYNLLTDQKFLSSIKKMGFEKIVFSDRHNRQWTYDIKDLP